MNWHEVRGFSTDIPEMYAQWLAECAPNDRFVEVGVYLGRSLCSLVQQASRMEKQIRICGIDAWSRRAAGAREHPGEYPTCKMSEARANINACGGEDVSLIRSWSANPIEIEAEYVFIDADHHQPAVLRDIKAWLPRTKKILGGHDYCRSHMGVMRAVDELLPGREIIGTCWQWRIPSVNPSA